MSKRIAQISGIWASLISVTTNANQQIVNALQLHSRGLTPHDPQNQGLLAVQAPFLTRGK